jgi:hypothetical protein
LKSYAEWHKLIASMLEYQNNLYLFPPTTKTGLMTHLKPYRQLNKNDILFYLKLNSPIKFIALVNRIKIQFKTKLAKEPNFATLVSGSNVIFKKKKMKNIFFILTGLLSILSGCVGNECKISKEMLSANGLDDNYCPKVDSTVKPLNKPSIKKVNIFFDASGSMTGYMPTAAYPNSELQIIVHDIISRLKTKYSDNITFYPIYNSSSKMESMKIEDAQRKITFGELTQSNGDTYLPIMLDSIYKGYFNSNTVNIFISDCIYDPNKKEKKLREQATTEISEAIKPYISDYSTSAFCLHSGYLKVNNSPYYLLVFGRPENNPEIENIVKTAISDNKQKFEEVNFGLKYTQPYYSVLPYTDKSENCIANPCENFQNAFVNVTVQNWNARGDSMSFWIGIDLRNYPEYATTQNYLDSNLFPTMEKGTARIISITKELPKGIEKDDKPIAEKSTHYVHIQISQLDDCAATLQLTLKFSKPNWIHDLNQDETESNGEKTFGLERMMKGFEQAYNPDGKAYFFKDLKVSLIKQ